ncbi:carbohydrate-binding family 9-like protein [Paenibacillus whitsoniae]|uniref:carbohydrate-binding family 9-like protein n=1 Tax=Paenibacillus whitsoniae TaxID=2496558 RepID=UPI0013DF399C|nr:carbohydrate-binding family 9-like protein [Paenibacillus whitsoniae]
MAYSCQFVQHVENSWNRLPSEKLTGVVAGEPPRLETTFQACWTEDSLYIRFLCEDDHVVATMTEHDDPIYQEDVVEVFVSPTGKLTDYYEFEVSPTGVLFDAFIHNHLNGSIDGDIAWHAPGFRAEITPYAEGWVSYIIRIPFADLDGRAMPADGETWLCNFYRIDDDREGNRHYWAWCPTGQINYHVPQKFGQMVFERRENY